MKIVIYNQSDNKVLDVIENVTNPTTEGDVIQWDGGSMNGIQHPFLIVDDSVEISETLDASIINKDKRGNVTIGMSKLDMEKNIRSIQKVVNQLLMRP